LVTWVLTENNWSLKQRPRAPARQAATKSLSLN
jgi:hypothetical protein